MACTINASTTAGLVSSADLTGSLLLQANGTTKFTADSTGAYGQVISGTAIASTSGTSIDFTSLPTWVKRITVMFNGISVNGTSHYLVQLGSGSVVTSGYVSCFGYLVSDLNANQTTSTAGFGWWNGASSDTTFGNYTLNLVTGNTWVGGISGCSNTSPKFGGGNISLGGTIDRVRITTVNGTDTFDAGSINILFE